MKNKVMLIGIIALMALIGFSTIGCEIDDEGSSSGGIDTSTGPNNFSGTSWVNSEDGVNVILSFTSSSWSIAIPGESAQSGSYTYNGNVAILKNSRGNTATATISGSRLYLDDSGNRITFTTYTPGGTDPGGTPQGSKPTVPREVKVKPDTESTMILEWRYPISTDATGYNIYRSSSSSGTYAKVGTTASTTYEYKDTGLSSNTTYYYKIAAYNDAGEGPQTDYFGNRTARLAGLSRETAIPFSPGAYGVFYFPPGVDELWFYFTNSQGAGSYTAVYNVSCWNKSYNLNYFTAGELEAAVYWDDSPSPNSGSYFGFQSAFDKAMNDGRKSAIIMGGNSIYTAKTIYFKVQTRTNYTPDLQKGTFALELVANY